MRPWWVRCPEIRAEASIFVDDRYVGNVGSSYYMGFDVEPGEQLVWSHFGGKRSFARKFALKRAHS